MEEGIPANHSGIAGCQDEESMNTAIIAFIIGVVVGYLVGVYLPIPGIKP